ncbi:MAG TPA: MarC family protein [Aquificae bacterium]|nr:MarC family protein [Aquificota bacterium]
MSLVVVRLYFFTILMGLDMIKAKVSEIKRTQEETLEAFHRDDIAIIPLGIPMLFGPGVFTTLLVFRAEAKENFILSFSLIMAFLSVTLLVYLILLNSKKISEYLGITGMNILKRIMGIVTGAVGIQFLISGVKSLWS